MIPNKRHISSIISGIIMIFIMSFILSCQKDWDEHYQSDSPDIEMNVWEAVKLENDYSTFVGYVEEFNLDTLFGGDQQFTLFIPDNNAFSKAPDSIIIDDKVLSYFISPTIFLVNNVEDSRLLQTISGKFARVVKSNGNFLFEGNDITFSSPLFNNGKFYEIENFSLPSMNLFEYISTFIPVLKDYIKLADSVFLDKTLSTPVGFDENGNTIYDSIFTTVNNFEDRIFPVGLESRDNYASLIFFNDEQYRNALNNMAVKLGGESSTYEDIPLEWQYSVLIPNYLKIGFFKNSLSYEELSAGNLVNISGEIVEIEPANINAESKYICSNGVVYNYKEFEVPDSLFFGSNKIEGEELIDSIGSFLYAWKDEVKVTGEIVTPQYSPSIFASEGASVVVPLPSNFSGEYTVEFKFKNIFPGRHRLLWRANYRPSGVYAIYVNDEKIGEFDNFYLRNSVISVTGERFAPDNGFNSKDFLVENIDEFGEVTIKFEYLGKGVQSNNGFNIDYISLIPEANK